MYTKHAISIARATFILKATSCPKYPTTLHPLPTTNFIRQFFSGARAANPQSIMAAKSKAQDIIDNNAVGTQHRDLVVENIILT